MIKYDGIIYATESNEQGVKLHKILLRKDEVKFYIDSEHGFGINKNGVDYQFHRHTKDNGRHYFWYQYTLRSDVESFKNYSLKHGLNFRG